MGEQSREARRVRRSSLGGSVSPADWANGTLCATAACLRSSARYATARLLPAMRHGTVSGVRGTAPPHSWRALWPCPLPPARAGCRYLTLSDAL